MNKIKKTIILLSILLIIVIIAIVIVFNLKKESQNEEYTVNNQNTNNTEIDKTLRIVDERMDYYAVKDCVDKYFVYYFRVFNPEDYQITNDQNTIKKNEAENLNVLYNMLDKEYIEEKQLSKDNLKTKLKAIGTSHVNITNIYKSEQSINIKAYLVEGVLRNKKTEDRREFKIIIKIDSSEEAFSIITQEFLEEKYNDLGPGKTAVIAVPETIEQNENNKVSYRSVKEETYIKDLYSKFKTEIQYFTEELYNKLEPTYKVKTFQEIEEFREYINVHKKKYLSAKIEKYQKSEKDNYIKYTCIDGNGNYYIFKETAPFKYTMILDNYTIPTDDFIETYNKNTDIKKVVLNIKRFFMAIDDKNYGYAYDVLSQEFKNNNYPAKSDFINYIEQNLFEQNELEYISYEEQNELYIYKIKVLDATGSNEKEIELNVIVKLNDGTDFELAFGVK